MLIVNSDKKDREHTITSTILESKEEKGSHKYPIPFGYILLEGKSELPLSFRYAGMSTLALITHA